MNIDWFTFVAQIFNFLVLVALLGRFLYRPIVQAMQKREDDIAERLSGIEQQRQEANLQKQRYEDLNRELNDQREHELRTMRREVQEDRETRLREMQEGVEQKRSEWRHGLRGEQEQLLQQLRQQSAHVSVVIARRSLKRLADAELEEQMWRRFLAELSLLDTELRNEITRSLSLSDGYVIVRSAFDIPEVWRERISAAVNTLFCYDGSIDYERSAELICGIEMDAGGYTLGWNMQDMLRELMDEMNEQLQANV